MSTTWDKLVAYWKQNIAANIKKISAMLGQMFTVIFATIILIVKEGYDWKTAVIVLALVIQPFFYWYVNVVFKGETELKDQEILQLQTRLEYQQEIAGYQVQLAAKNGKVPEAIMNVYDWNELNRKINEILENQNSTDDTKIYHTDTDTSTNP
jgi:hypothetical protein